MNGNEIHSTRKIIRSLFCIDLQIRMREKGTLSFVLDQVTTMVTFLSSNTYFQLGCFMKMQKKFNFTIEPTKFLILVQHVHIFCFFFDNADICHSPMVINTQDKKDNKMQLKLIFTLCRSF